MNFTPDLPSIEIIIQLIGNMKFSKNKSKNFNQIYQTISMFAQL